MESKTPAHLDYATFRASHEAYVQAAQASEKLAKLYRQLAKNTLDRWNAEARVHNAVAAFFGANRKESDS